MNADEQKLLSGLFDRTRQAADTPRDPEAERFILEQIKSQPSAPYLLAQAVIVQEHGLNACNERIQALEAQVKDLQNAPPPQQQSGGLLGSIFGSSQSAQPSQPSPGRFSGPWGGGGAAPQDAYAPQGQPPQAGRWAAPPQPQAQGGGFLQGALTTAAGVAGGALMFEGIKNMMGGNSLFGGSGGATGNTPQAGETVINNYYNDDKGTGTQNDYAEMDRLDDAYDDAQDSDTDDDNVA
ncbi:DUF2076 domain-containing protein [Phyllobacterium myrsinacearum]|uniref:DUF2076 domain-containing protein n=1 Tax=Phyllobacterium myrsinacearum TaxID=28101 RepID=A0A2S9JFJ6_9HYPH|nr:DUF2076 domain-containing protein [Phyllobacterium myrsinacearum]PRD51694.1 DUF2076 domain-containing protein [Phyllobacterium myrsinacearum]PWV86250.1 hypothetical protein DEV92_1177 [Phyllobacterium myrsinacearum]RZS79298.1 hypothetical protein EV217_4164 [Phyllobacterium myrsinacearum]RZU99974.1 hypothetical protein EV654_4111 [Phyllobacterium myrsinacearum]